VGCLIGKQRQLLETKGREDFDTEVARQDAHAEWWCSQVTAQTGVSWKYAKLSYRRFHAKWPQTFAQLTEMLKPAPGLNLSFESKPTTADAASWWL
jgi:hypothetical protein